MDSFESGCKHTVFFTNPTICNCADGYHLFGWLPKIKSYELKKSTERCFLGIVRFQL